MSKNTTSNMSKDTPSNMSQTTSSNMSRNTTSNMSKNTTSDTVWGYHLKKILGVQPQIVFKNTTAKCLRVWPLIMSGIPPQFVLFFSYIYNCSPWLHYSFMLLDWGLDHGVTLLIYVLFPLTVCGVRQMGGLEVGGEDFSVSVSGVC